MPNRAIVVLFWTATISPFTQTTHAATDLAAGATAWASFPSLKLARSHHGVAVVDTMTVCAIAGCTADCASAEPKITDRVECIDKRAKDVRWIEKASLHTRRMDLGAGEINNFIAAIGGRTTGGEVLASVEYYNPETYSPPDSWVSGGNLTTARYGHAVATWKGGDDARPVMHVVGGFDAQNAALNSAEYMLIDTAKYPNYPGKWKPVKATMIQKRAFFGIGDMVMANPLFSSAATVRCLCAVGGEQEGNQVIGSMECFGTWKDGGGMTWITMPQSHSLRPPRTQFAMVTAGDRNMLILGGRSAGPNSDALATAETLTGPSGSSFSTAAPMTTARSNFGVCQYNSGVSTTILAVGGEAKDGQPMASTELCSGKACFAAPTPAPTSAPSDKGLGAGEIVTIVVAGSMAAMGAALFYRRRRSQARRRRRPSAREGGGYARQADASFDYGSMDIALDPLQPGPSPERHRRRSTQSTGFSSTSDPGSADRAKELEHIRQLELRVDRQEQELEKQDAIIKHKDSVIEDRDQEVVTLQEAWRISVDDLRLDAFVAAGSEGRVYRGKWRGQFDVAIKMIARDITRPDTHGFSNAEVKAMQRLRGSRLVHFCT